MNSFSPKNSYLLDALWWNSLAQLAFALCTRILASCLEDPLLGVNGGANVTPVNNFIQSDPSIKQPHDTSPTATFSSSSPLHHQHDAVTPNTTPSQIVSLDRHGHHEDDSARQDEQGDDAERETTMPLQLLPAIAGARQDDQAPAESGVKYDAFTDADGSKECKRGSWQRAAGMDADPQLWPETVPLPTTTRIDVVGGLGEEQRSVRGKGRTEARYLDAKMLKEALRLFLAKLQVPVEVSSEYASTPPPLIPQFSPGTPSFFQARGGLVGRTSLGFPTTNLLVASGDEADNTLACTTVRN